MIKVPYGLKGNCVIKKTTGETVKCHPTKEKALAHLKALEVNVKEMEHEIKDVELKFKVNTFEVKESDPEGKWVKVGGEALRPIKSRNGITYTQQNVTELDGQKAKFFMTHDLNPKNVVGHVNFTKEGDVLMYDAEIRNTDTWTDVTESAKDKFFDVSIDARYGQIVRSTSEGEIEYNLTGMEMRGLCGVGVGGIPTNSVDYAIAEEFKKNDEKNVSKLIKQEEAKQMAEDDKLAKVVAEKERLEKEVSSFKAEAAKRKEDEKTVVIEKLLKLNKELVKNDLADKTISELEIMLGYEQKLAKEDEEEAGDEEKEKPEEGQSEVDDKEKAKEEDKVVIEKDGDIGFSKKMYDNFNKEVRDQI